MPPMFFVVKWRKEAFVRAHKLIWAASEEMEKWKIKQKMDLMAPNSKNNNDNYKKTIINKEIKMQIQFYKQTWVSNYVFNIVSDKSIGVEN